MKELKKQMRSKKADKSQLESTIVDGKLKNMTLSEVEKHFFNGNQSECLKVKKKLNKKIENAKSQP